jgi:hypothetical protein
MPAEAPQKQGHSGWRVCFESAESGVTPVDAILAAGLFAILATATIQILGDAGKRTRGLKNESDIASVGNYIMQFTDCAKTRADAGFTAACAGSGAVNIRDKRDQIIVASTGTTFADYLTVTNICKDGEIQLMYTTNVNSTPSALLSGIPISCPNTTVPPACTLVAKRFPMPPTTCTMTVVSTGGAIVGSPKLPGVKTFKNKGSTWTGTMGCGANDQTFTATITGLSGDTASCSASLTSIPIWIQTNGGLCSNVCAAAKRVSVRSPFYKNTCVSGEVRGDAFGVAFVRGVWGSGAEFFNSNSFGGECYGSNPRKGQKHDHDPTDITVGCYCK